MNFSFLNECEIRSPWMQDAYQEIGRALERAEEVYWERPQECGALLRGAAEQICHVYNTYYEIGFGPEASLEEFLCYTDSDEHNILVSRFLSVVRKEQRDRLTKIRVLGDDCVCTGENNMQGMEDCDRMSQNVKRMMEAMMETLKDMCRKLNDSKELEGLRFELAKLPGKPQADDAGGSKKDSFLNRIFKGRK